MKVQLIGGPFDGAIVDAKDPPSEEYAMPIFKNKKRHNDLPQLERVAEYHLEMYDVDVTTLASKGRQLIRVYRYVYHKTI